MEERGDSGAGHTGATPAEASRTPDMTPNVLHRAVAAGTRVVGRGEDRGTGWDSHLHSSPLGMPVTGVRRTCQPAASASPLEDNDVVVVTGPHGFLWTNTPPWKTLFLRILFFVPQDNACVGLGE